MHKGALATEVRRIARMRIRKAMRKEGLRITDFSAMHITRAAEMLANEDKSILSQAKRNLKRWGVL